ncbi:MAG: hypothetical protein KGI98_13680 [Euryarchaeota archaeon]|nr:hypothetical protein [Euryarchaeota archaeon]MDE1882249.1 hypothetical protein [Euryarchaeota archaeon]
MREIPAAVRDYQLSPSEQDQVERIVERTGPGGKELVRRLRRTGRIENLGEIQAMVIAKTVGGIVVTDDPKAQRVARARLGPQFVWSSDEALKRLREELHPEKKGTGPSD